VIVLDHAPEPGRKILISGGGRCNFTNIHASHERYLSANKHFARSALSRYTAADFLALVERYGIAWHEKTLGQLFCDGSAREILAMLVEECRVGGVERLRHGTGRGQSCRWFVPCPCGDQVLSARNLVIATGGPSIPRWGRPGSPMIWRGNLG
jgi:predicted flavoprotein YhiN